MNSKWAFLLVGTVLAVMAGGWIIAKNDASQRSV